MMRGTTMGLLKYDEALFRVSPGKWREQEPVTSSIVLPHKHLKSSQNLRISSLVRASCRLRGHGRSFRDHPSQRALMPIRSFNTEVGFDSRESPVAVIGEALWQAGENRPSSMRRFNRRGLRFLFGRSVLGEKDAKHRLEI